MFYIKGLFLISITIPVAIIDQRSLKIPNLIIIPGIIAAMMIDFFYCHISVYEIIVSFLTGFMVFFLIFYFSKGKMGFGDVKFSAFLALVLGMEIWFVMIFLASFSALVFALIALKSGAVDRNSKIPFGPFLGAAAIVAFSLRGWELI